MSVKVAFREAANPAQITGRSVTIPKSAVQQQDGHDVVLVVQNGRVERRAVTVSSTRDEEVMISAGVGSGEKVVADWPKGLVGGMAVKEMNSSKHE